jgi:hypothetical protein
VSATGTVSTVPTNGALAGLVLTANVTYSMEIIGPSPNVNVSVFAAGGITHSAYAPGSADGSATASLSVTSTSPFGGTPVNDSLQLSGGILTGCCLAGPGITGSAATGYSGGFTEANTYNLLTDTIYTVTLSIQLFDSIIGNPANGSIFGSSGGTESVSAFLDPLFLAPDGYTVLTSDGIGNSPASATPLPAALPLFASGLGVMGFLARRRKRKNAAIAGA